MKNRRILSIITVILCATLGTFAFSLETGGTALSESVFSADRGDSPLCSTASSVQGGQPSLFSASVTGGTTPATEGTVLTFTDFNQNNACFTDYLISTAEIFYLNISVRGFCTVLLGQTWLPVDLNTIQDSITSPWKWDNSRFFKNQVAHPYFGSMYYTAARANNLGFIGSSLMTAFGSFTWETCMEAGNVSLNDFITTTMTGITVGEVLFRLGNSAATLWAPLEWPVNPVGSITNTIRNSRPTDPLGSIYLISLKAGGGGEHSTVSFVNQDGTPSAWEDETYATPMFFMGTTLTYGNPWGHQTEQIFDQFQVDLQADINTHSKVKAEIEGMLYSIALGKDKESSSGDNPNSSGDSPHVETTLGTTLNYTVSYGKEALLSENSAGIVFSQIMFFQNTENLHTVSYKANLNWTFLSAKSNWFLLHNDSRVTSSSPYQPCYTYCYGPQATLTAFYSHDILGEIKASTSAQFLFPYAGSAYDSSFESTSLLWDARIEYSHALINNLYITLEGSVEKEFPLKQTIPAAKETHWGGKAYLEWIY